MASIFREPPRGVLAVLARAPAWLYRHRMGWLLGRRFLMITHRGRTTGRLHRTVVEVVSHDERTGEYVVVAAWGRRSDWYRNIEAHPAVGIAVGNHRFVPEQRILDRDEALGVLRSYRRRHPLAFRVLARVLGPGASAGEDGLRAFVRIAPVLGFRPVHPERGPRVPRPLT